MDFLFPLSLIRFLPDLTISMSNMACVLKEAGTDYPSQEPGFTPGFWWGLCCSPFYFLCCVVHLCFVWLHPVSCVPNIADVAGLSILDFPFGFLYCFFSSII